MQLRRANTQYQHGCGRAAPHLETVFAERWHQAQRVVVQTVLSEEGASAVLGGSRAALRVTASVAAVGNRVRLQQF